MTEAAVKKAPPKKTQAKKKTVLRVRRMGNKFACNGFFFASSQRIEAWECFETEDVDQFEKMLKTHLEIVQPKDVGEPTDRAGVFNLKDAKEIRDIIAGSGISTDDDEDDNPGIRSE